MGLEPNPPDKRAIAERYPVFYRGRPTLIGQIPEPERVVARDDLEAALEAADLGRVPGGEVAIRKMLRALYLAIGPNTDRAKAFQWPVLAIFAPDVRLEWEDTIGSKQTFQSRVDDPETWRRWIEREMQRLSDFVFEKSLGRICLVPVVLTSEVPLTYLERSDARYYCTAAGAKPLIDYVIGTRQVLSIFVWIPTEGTGAFPPRRKRAKADTASPGRGTRGATLTVIYTSRERMEKVGGWANPDGYGILHEFGRIVTKSIRGLGFRGFIPGIRCDEHFEMLKAEYREQGFPEPRVRYDALLCSYPTWKMCRALGQKVARR